MSSSPESRSQASLSPTNSLPLATANDNTSLDALVSHLLASKRSLSSISTVWRANEIVTSARASFEESAIHSARTEFLRSGIEEEVGVLSRVRNGIEGVYRSGQNDFKDIIRTLDAANARLEATIDVLRATIVESAFRPANEEPRSLLDFVDTDGVENMRDTLKEFIRDSREAQTQFDTSILSFDDDLRAIKASLSTPLSLVSSQANTPNSPILDHLQTLESDAQDMASLLDSLVSHFDLCVNAIRHTEGGYAAVEKAALLQPPDSEPVSVSGVMNRADDGEQPMSDEERREMLDVLEKDAAQVEDVVLELGDFLAEMEAKHKAILEHVSHQEATYTSMLSSFQILESVSARLSNYVIASQDFCLKWEDTKLNIQEQLAELEGIRMFYENYWSSYDGLVLEVSRRRIAEERCKAIIRKAMEQVDQVVAVDKVERDAFRSDVGEFLPVDLWSGISAQPPTWDFVRRAQSEEATESVPELSRTVVEAARRRDRERQSA